MSASKADRSSMQRVLERLHQKLTAAVCKVLECLQKGGDPYGSPPFYAEAKFGIR